MNGREIHLAQRPEGLPKPSDFTIVERAVRPPGDGELLVRNTWMSLDPSQRIRMHAGDSPYLVPYETGAVLDGWAVGTVVESRAEGFAAGDTVLHQFGWRDYATMATEGARPPLRVTVDDLTPDRHYVGALGWTALTSYAGLLYVAEMREGDVVFISGAAGAVGSLAVQIAKVKGNVVIGSAGTPEKVALVTGELGADAAFCYRDGDVGELLRGAAPDGIDVYFDNVGGDHLEAALDSLRAFGRVALCGMISTYNRTEPVPGPANLFNAVAKGLTLRGFLARMYADRLEEFRRDMAQWMADGSVTYRETVVEGLESAPEGFISMLSGGNVGKTIVRV